MPIHHDSKSTNKPHNNSYSSPYTKPEQKPNYKFSSPQAEFRRQNLSPNTAEGKDRLGLKDLAKLVSQNQAATPEPAENHKPATNREKQPKNRGKKGKYQNKKHSNATPNASPVKPVLSPVHPEVEYQEKSTVEIKPDSKSAPLSTPVKRADKYADVDNSVDGFLAIKH